MKKVSAVVVFLTLLPSVAVAAERPRFRGGVEAQGGSAFMVKDGVVSPLGGVGLAGQIGVQRGFLGAYVYPSVDGMYGKDSLALHMSTALASDFAMADDRVQFGFGGVVAVTELVTVAERKWLGHYGVLGRVAFNPVLRLGENGRRKALTVGLNLRFLAGGAGYYSQTLTVGYQAF